MVCPLHRRFRKLWENALTLVLVWGGHPASWPQALVHRDPLSPHRRSNLDGVPTRARASTPSPGVATVLAVLMEVGRGEGGVGGEEEGGLGRADAGVGEAAGGVTGSSARPSLSRHLSGGWRKSHLFSGKSFDVKFLCKELNRTYVAFASKAPATSTMVKQIISRLGRLQRPQLGHRDGSNGTTPVGTGEVKMVCGSLGGPTTLSNITHGDITYMHQCKLKNAEWKKLRKAADITVRSLALHMALDQLWCL